MLDVLHLVKVSAVVCILARGFAPQRGMATVGLIVFRAAVTLMSPDTRG